MDVESTKSLNELALNATAELKSFFESSPDDNKQRRVDVALKLLGRINGNDSNRLKMLALQFQIARSMGLKGEPLRPLLAELSPSFDEKKAIEGKNEGN